MKIRALVTVLVVGALSACGGTFADNDNVDHRCTLLRTSGRWHAEIELFHNDPRSCPAGGQVNDLRSAGGTLKDVFAVTQQQARLSSVELKIFNMNDTECYVLGSVMGYQQQSFLWGDFNGSGTPSWHGPVFAEYRQGTWNQNYDCPVFYAHYYGGDQGIAWTRIKYYVTDM